MFISIKIFHVSLIETLTYLNISLLLLKKFYVQCANQSIEKGIYINTVAKRRRRKRISSPLPIYCINVRIIIRFSNWYTSYINVSHMKIAVIGAGPAGILLVAEAYLQCKKNNRNDTIIYWYDKEHFLSGMMDKYQVPSNTKMDYLDQGLGFFTESPIGPLAKLFPEIQQKH